jgi:uncharacterized protein DUF4153
VAGVLLVVFGSLLVSADPIFASFVRIPNLDIQAVVQHAVVIAVLAWVLGGWARGALIEKSDAFARVGPPVIKLGSLEITTAFVTLIVLFVAFIAAQVGWLFGGEAFLRARTGLTAAAYARDGFFQMVFVVALVVPLLVATRASLEPGFALARRHTMLALPVVVLLGAIIASAALRMRLYIQYFGLSTDRVYALAFMAWLAFVLVWLSVTTLRGRARRFGPGLVLSALTTVGGLNVVVPDVIVARVNVARARASAQPLDVAYLANLSGEASAWAVESALAEARAVPVPAQPFDRCATFNRLVQRWGLGSPARTRVADWRSWNAAESHAVRVVRAHDTEIEQIRTTACAAAKAASAAAKPVIPAAQR